MQRSVWPVYMCYLCTLESTQSHKANVSRAPPIHRFLINLSAIVKCTIAIIKHEVIINILSLICGIPSIKNEKSSLFTVLWRVRLCWYCDLLLDWSPFYNSSFPFLKTKDVQVRIQGGGPGGPGPPLTLGFEAPKLSIFGPYLIFP